MTETPDIPKLMEALHNARSEARHAEHVEAYGDSREGRERAAKSRSYYEQAARRFRQEIIDSCEGYPGWEGAMYGAVLLNPDLSEIAAELRDVVSADLSRFGE